MGTHVASIAAIAGLLLAPSVAIGQQPPAPAPPPTPSFVPTFPPSVSDSALLDALHRGGLVVYVRHGKTDWAHLDKTPVVIGDCSTQRMLSDSGRLQAKETAVAFQRLHVPIGDVRTSPYCRAVEYARLAFGRERPDTTLTEITRESPAVRERRVSALVRTLGTAAPDGRTTVLVGHQDNLQEATRSSLGVMISVGEGEAAIFRPNGTGTFVFLGHKSPAAWTALADYAVTHSDEAHHTTTHTATEGHATDNSTRNHS